VSELKQEFFQRSITAIFISAIVITLILYSSNMILNIFISILSLALLLEWMSVSKSRNGKRLIFLILFFILISSDYYFGGLFEPISFITMLGITVWIVVAYQIFLKEGRLSSNFAFNNLWVGLLLITAFYLVCFQLVTESRIFLLAVICNTAVFDTGAYIIGKNFGRNSFLPKLSPNKTIEGLIGGLISSFLFVIFAYLFLKEVSFMLALAMILGTPFALCGDYFFSFLKRKADVKDTGSILPGHGGLLDRVDSHLAAIPMTLFFSLLLSSAGSYF
jgi:phosphatidate cytidylyltransferase